MAAEAARVLELPDGYIFGSAAPARAGYAEPPARQAESPMRDERVRQRERARAAAAVQSAPAISVFAVIGAILSGVMMVLVVLAQISYNEIANETVRLNTQQTELAEQRRRLEITFNSVIDMKEVERYARDVLGMSRPEVDTVAAVISAPGDRVEILRVNRSESSLREFGTFISSLLDHFRR